METATQYRPAAPVLGGKVRFAVVGLGHIAQVAVLPAFHHAEESSHLEALGETTRAGTIDQTPASG